MSFWNKFDPVNSAVAGVMSGPEATTRQLALGLIKTEVARRIAEDPKSKRFFLDLVPEPDNAHDPEAIQIMADVPGLGRTQLGYVRNSDTVCGFCENLMERFPASKKCSRCGNTDLRRDGLATKVCRAMREDPTARFYGELIAITGGAEGKNLGCNYQVKKVFERKKKA